MSFTPGKPWAMVNLIEICKNSIEICQASGENVDSMAKYVEPHGAMHCKPYKGLFDSEKLIFVLGQVLNVVCLM
jgi:hypothetical protein